MTSAFQLAIAEPEHGEAICRLTGSDRDDLANLDWTNLGGQWVVALREGRVIACVQVLPGKPIGQVEHLGLAEELTHRERCEVVSMLFSQCCMLLQLAGCGAVMTTAPESMPSWRKVLRRRGGRKLRTCELMIKRLG